MEERLSMTIPRRAFLLALAVLALAASPALAQHEKIRARPDNTPKKPEEAVQEEIQLDTLLYEPEYCDFFAAFPSEPMRSRRCEIEDPSRCYDLVSYTKVIEMTSTVKAEIVCNPLPAEAFEAYTQDVMKKTVEAMAMGEVMQGFEPNVREEANFKQAGMIGRGRAGVGDTIFVAQLWVGRNSIMAVQAEIMGDPSETAEKHFAEILGGIGYRESEEEKAQRLEAERKADEEAAQQATRNEPEKTEENKDAPAP